MQILFDPGLVGAQISQPVRPRQTDRDRRGVVHQPAVLRGPFRAHRPQIRELLIPQTKQRSLPVGVHHQLAAGIQQPELTDRVVTLRDLPRLRPRHPRNKTHQAYPIRYHCGTTAVIFPFGFVCVTFIDVVAFGGNCEVNPTPPGILRPTGTPESAFVISPRT